MSLHLNFHDSQKLCVSDLFLDGTRIGAANSVSAGSVTSNYSILTPHLSNPSDFVLAWFEERCPGFLCSTDKSFRCFVIAILPEGMSHIVSHFPIIFRSLLWYLWNFLWIIFLVSIPVSFSSHLWRSPVFIALKASIDPLNLYNGLLSLQCLISGRTGPMQLSFLLSRCRRQSANF